MRAGSPKMQFSFGFGNLKNCGSETGAGGGLETGIVSAANLVPPFSDPWWARYTI